VTAPAPTTSKPATATTAASGETTTAPPAAAAGLPPGDNPVVAAGPLHGNSTANNSGKSSSRAGQVAVAIGLIGATGLGAAFGFRRLRAGASP
jgi:hypothetical protein